MTEVADRMKHALKITGGNPDAVDGNTEAWKNCDFCSNRREVCTKDTEWEPCPRCSTRPLAPVPTKPKECKCEEAEAQRRGFAFGNVSMHNPDVTRAIVDAAAERLAEPSGISGQLPEMETPVCPRCVPEIPENCLQTADRLTSQDRNEAYGHPLDDYECTAALWTAILRRKGLLKPGVSVDAETSQLMMVGVKISREAGHHKADNLIDGAGYFRTIEMTIQERHRRQLAALEELTRLGQEQGGYE